MLKLLPCWYIKGGRQLGTFADTSVVVCHPRRDRGEEGNDGFKMHVGREAVSLHPMSGSTQREGMAALSAFRPASVTAVL